MRKVECTTSCRIDNPEEIKGDYLRGRTYENHLLVSLHGGEFRLVEEEHEQPPEHKKRGKPNYDQEEDDKGVS